MLGYVASCLGLSPTARDRPPSIEPPDSSPTLSSKKVQIESAANASAAAASYAAAAAVKPTSSQLERVPPICSSDNIVPIKGDKRVVKLPPRLFISRRSAHRSEFFINLSARRGKEKSVCLSEGNLPFRLSPFEGQLTVVRKSRRFRSDTMNQKTNGCDIPRSRTSSRRRTSRSPGCYFCEADAYASLAAAGWTCSTTESMVPAPDQVQYLYHMPYFPPAQTYHEYPVEFESQYLEYAQAPSPTFVTYPPPSPKLSQLPSPRTVIQCPPCPTCPQCPIPTPRMQRSPPRSIPYDRGLCESADMTTSSVSESISPARSSSRSRKKMNESQQYYPVPFEDDARQFPSRCLEGEDAEQRRWKASRQRYPRDWRDIESLETQRSSDGTLWSRIPTSNESRNNSSSSRITSPEATKESRQMYCSADSTGRSHCRPSSLVSSTRKRKLPSERSVRNTEMATQTSVGRSKEFLSEDFTGDEDEAEDEEPATVATQTSLQVLVVDRKKGSVDSESERPFPERRSSLSNSSRTSPRISKKVSSKISPRPSFAEQEVDEALESRLSPSVIVTPPPEPEDNEESGDVANLQEEGSRKEAGQDTSPTMSFSTGSGSFQDQYMTPPLILCEANNPFNHGSESPGILGELSTELQALAARVAMLEQKRSLGNSGTFIPEVLSEPIGDNVQPFTAWHKDKCEGGVLLPDGDEDEEEEVPEDDGETAEECDVVGSYDRSPRPGRIHRHTCSFSNIEEADWPPHVCQPTTYIGSDMNCEPTIPVSGMTIETPNGGWCSATNVGVARSSPNLHSISQPSTRTPTVSTSNEEYVCGHEPELVRARTGGMVAVQAMSIHPTLGLGNSHWKKIHMDVGVGDWDFATSAWSAGVTGPMEEPKNIQITKEAGEGGENYHMVPPPPPPSPQPSPVGDGAAAAETDQEDRFKVDGVDEVQVAVDEVEKLEKVVQEEEGEVEEEEEEVVEDVDKVVNEEEKSSDEISTRAQNSTPFLLDSVLFPPLKASPAGTPFLPSMENLRKRCVVPKEEVEKTSSSTQTLVKTSLDSDQLQLFSAFQRVVALGESKLDEGLGLMDSVAIEIDLCRLEAITHIAYVVLVVCLFLLLTTLLSFIVN